jgi:hypothetical protein
VACRLKNEKNTIAIPHNTKNNELIFVKNSTIGHVTLLGSDIAPNNTNNIQAALPTYDELHCHLVNSHDWLNKQTAQIIKSNTMVSLHIVKFVQELGLKNKK